MPHLLPVGLSVEVLAPGLAVGHLVMHARSKGLQVRAQAHGVLVGDSTVQLNICWARGWDEWVVLVVGCAWTGRLDTVVLCAGAALQDAAADSKAPVW